MATIFDETKILFLKLGWLLCRYPVGQKFRQNCSIVHGFQDISIFMFCKFCEKFENSEWPLLLMRQNFFENCDGYFAEIPCWSKIS